MDVVVVCEGSVYKGSSGSQVQMEKGLFVGTVFGSRDNKTYVTVLLGGSLQNFDGINSELEGYFGWHSKCSKNSKGESTIVQRTNTRGR